MLYDDFNVMLIYDFCLKTFKMPHTHICLELSLDFHKTVPHFYQSVNALI